MTASDVLADAQRIPVDSRARVISEPANAARMASNIYIRRVMADQAQAAGLAADPVLAAAIQLARDKVLSDAWLARIDKEATPPIATLEKRARDAYTAKPERFMVDEQVRARHILISKKAETGKADAEKILGQLKAGGDFAAIAKEKSIDTNSAVKGGDLGFFAKARMVPEFGEAAFKMTQAGELSEVVESQFGYHIIKFESRRPAGPQPFDEVKETLINEIRSNLQQTARSSAAQRIEDGSKLNAEAVAAFAQSQKEKP